MNASIEKHSLEPASPPPGDKARSFASLIFSTLLALIALVAIPYGAVESWWRALFECAVFGLAALWIIEGFVSGAWSFSNYRLFWPLLALAALAFVQTLPLGAETNVSLSIGGSMWQAISADPHGTRNWIAEMLALILVGAMLQHYTVNERRLRTLVYLVVGVALVSAMFGLLRQMTQTQAGFILPNLYPKLGYAQFINKNHFAFLIEMAVGLVLGIVVWGVLSRERLLVAVGVVLLLGGTLVLANSRGGIFSLFGQFLFAALLFSAVRPVRTSDTSANNLFRRVRRLGASFVVRAVLTISFLIVIAIGIVWVGGGPLVGGLESMSTEVGAPGDSTRWAVRRWDLWPATWKLIKDHPLMGVGFGGYWMAITAYHDGSGEMTPQEAHNDWLEFLASGGLIGVALGVWFLYSFIRTVRERLRASDSFVRAARCGAIVGIAGLAIHCLVDFGLHIPINAVMFIVLIVIATVDVRGSEQTTLANGSVLRSHQF
jgi:O-antigen ligase